MSVRDLDERDVLNAACSGEADPRPRRRDGHDDPAPQARPKRISAASASRGIPHDLKGNNDLLVLTRPDVIGRHPSRIPRGRQRHHRDQHLQQHRDRAGRLRPRAARLRAQRRGARLARPAADEWTRADARAAAVRRRLDRADQPDRCPSRPTSTTRRSARIDLRRAARGVQGAGPRPDRRRLRPAAARDDRRHAERQGRHRRDRGGVRGATAVRLPLMISVTVTDRSGRTLSGQTIDAFWVSIAHAKPFSVGINCALGARDMRPYVAELARIADCYVSCYPNAGSAQRLWRVRRTADRHRPATSREFAASGFVNIVGGCCGTTPEHIAAIADGGRRACRREIAPQSTAPREGGIGPVPVSPSSPASKRSPSAPTATSR